MLLLLLLLPADILLTCSCQPCCWPGPLCSAAGLAPSALLAGLADAVLQPSCAGPVPKLSPGLPCSTPPAALYICGLGKALTLILTSKPNPKLTQTLTVLLASCSKHL